MEEQRAAATTQRGRPFPPGVSGNPQGGSVINRRADELFAGVAADFGVLSATDEILLRAACRLLARAEKTKDEDAAVRLSSEGRRGIDALRRRHTPKHDSEPRLEDIAQAAEDGTATGGALIENTTPSTDRPAAKLMALDAAPPKTDAELLGMDEDTYRRFLAGEAI